MISFKLSRSVLFAVTQKQLSNLVVYNSNHAHFPYLEDRPKMPANWSLERQRFVAKISDVKRKWPETLPLASRMFVLYTVTKIIIIHCYLEFRDFK
ncbi:hypothetical protein CEXT_44411 [Caerostris extrusa]|uniref:Uncharacterized protein n=1 Tax=Caerostris extrusa TaxID=172846 RepID=A0AAV4W1W3_CAEEX|nr:hypothetical protein CEXT_44411 [Caerostris extrusa]